MSEEPKNVVAALAAVESEIGGIAKMSADERRKKGLSGGDERGVNYSYRGIDQIAAAAQPLFGRHGIVLVPSVASRETNDIVVNSKPWTDTWVLVNWRIYGPGGIEDCVEASTEGWGRDNSDKGINKAMTGAYKNLLLRLLCIGDPQDDTDGHTHEADSRPVEDPAEREAKDAEAGEVHAAFEAVKAQAGTPIADSLKALAEDHGKKLTEAALRDPQWRQTVLDLIETMEAP